MEGFEMKKMSAEAKHKFIIIMALILIWVAFSVMHPSYISYSNIMTILMSTSVNGILALGVAWAIMTAGIDISIGTVMTFSCVCSGLFFNHGVPMVLSILLGIGVGALCGFVNGILIAKFSLPAMIATLSMQMITKGLSLVFSNLKPVYFLDSPWYQKIASGNFLGINGFYNAIIIFAAVAFVSYILFDKTTFGRFTLAIGSNMEATRLSGIPVDKCLIRIYTVCGIYSAIAGVVMSSRLNSAQPALGPGYEMDAIAAAVIGGNSLSGGEGTIGGAVIGALVISSIQNGLRIMQVSTESQSAIIGVVLIIAVATDQMSKKRNQNK